MLISFILLAVIAAGGLALTYLIADDEPLFWRLAAGSAIGSTVFGVVCFATALVAGLTAATATIALVITVLPLLIFLRHKFRDSIIADWRRAKNVLQGGSLRKFAGLAYYLAFFLLLWFFFERAMYETTAGIFTGGSQNYGDLPFHLGTITSFTDGANFPPENPSFAGAKFSYPFIADLVTAAFVKLGGNIAGSMFVQNFVWAFSLLILLERFVIRLTGSRLAGKLAPVLLFFSGGLGFIDFFSDLAKFNGGFADFLWHLPGDYTINETYRWGNSLVVLFLTQRSLLLGMPLALVALTVLWKIFSGKDRTSETIQLDRTALVPPFVTGIVTGMLPLVHLHSLAVLFVVTAFLLAMTPRRWREFFAFGAGVCITAIPMLAWSVIGTASDAGSFFELWFGWNKGEQNFLWFWLTNTGLTIPLLIFGLYLAYSTSIRDKVSPKHHKKHSKHVVAEPLAGHRDLLEFYIPFAFLFAVSNAAKLAPWEWDNIKVLIYWFVGSLPFIAIALVWMWRKDTALRVAAVVCMVILTLAGAIDVWRTVSGQVKTRVLDADAVAIASRIKAVTPPRALFLNAPTFNTAMVMTGRRSFMRYTGHLGSHGIDYREREAITKEIYQGGPRALALLRENGIEYVLISPEERNILKPDEAFFKQFPIAAEIGEYKVYKIK